MCSEWEDLSPDWGKLPLGRKKNCSLVGEDSLLEKRRRQLVEVEEALSRGGGGTE